MGQQEERAAATLLRAARRVVVFTGAGISAESGVPTFRDALTGLWQQYDAQALATPEAFHADPALVWGWYEWRRDRVRLAQPNAGHLAVAAIEAHLPGTVVVTQNVDDLHERAGSATPVHLHGSLFAPRCSACAAPAPAPRSASGSKSGSEAGSASGSKSGSEAESGSEATGAEPADGRRLTPPGCARCSAPIRPGVVWFGEALPQTALEAAVEAASSCDLLLTVGTSGLVYPAAEIPQVAARLGATVIQVNPERTALDQVAQVNLRGAAAAVLPALVEATWGEDRPE